MQYRKILIPEGSTARSWKQFDEVLRRPSNGCLRNLMAIEIALPSISPHTKNHGMLETGSYNMSGHPQEECEVLIIGAIVDL